VLNNDRIVAVNSTPVTNWDELKAAVSAHPGDPVDLTIERGHETIHKTVTPAPKGHKDAEGNTDEGLIHVRAPSHIERVSLADAAKFSVILPPRIVYDNVLEIGKVIAGKSKLQVSGPPGIVKMAARQAKDGLGPLLMLLGGISAYLGAFNLLPFPALDGGRLLFLGAEAVSRRKPDAKVEAHVHAIGLLILLTLIAFVSYKDVVTR
jgi:regulator of sigma E protease